jgi:hypothetical protein
MENDSPFKDLFDFESEIAEFYGAAYGVAVDCCTHAIELCLRLRKYHTVTLPDRTYISVPFMCQKINQSWKWTTEEWSKFYHITPDIVDAAVLFERDSYIPKTKMCLSFQFKKHINIGRGGMVLLDDKDERDRLVKMRYDGRSIYDGVLHKNEDITEIGYHYYMTPENARLGIDIFQEKKDLKPKEIGSKDYMPLTDFSVFKSE